MRPSSMTPEEARNILKLPPRFADYQLTRAYRKAAAAAHPDVGGDAEEMKLINAAREVLLPLAVTCDDISRGDTWQAPQGTSSVMLTITPEADLLGPDRLWLGQAATVQQMIRYCEACGWSYQLTRELPTEKVQLPARKRRGRKVTA